MGGLFLRMEVVIFEWQDYKGVKHKGIYPKKDKEKIKAKLEALIDKKEIPGFEMSEGQDIFL